MKRMTKITVNNFLNIIACIWLISAVIRLFAGQMDESILNMSFTGLSIGWLASQAHNEQSKR